MRILVLVVCFTFLVATCTADMCPQARFSMGQISNDPEEEPMKRGPQWHPHLSISAAALLGITLTALGCYLIVDGTTNKETHYMYEEIKDRFPDANEDDWQVLKQNRFEITMGLISFATGILMIAYRTAPKE